MEILDRYLQAVKFWLPKDQKQDIIAELSEDLRSQIEDRENELGRKLSQSEVAAILNQSGRPVLVANRFLPQQSLIGPVLFPIYLFVLKIVALFYLVPWILVWITLAIFHPTHASPSVIEAVGSFWSSFWAMAFFAVGTVTMVFAVIERVQARSGFLEQWDPLKLPPVRDRNKIPRSGSMIEVTANLVWCIWLIAGIGHGTSLHFSELTITLSPAWRYFFYGFLLVALINTISSATNLFRPHWTVGRASVRLITDGLGSALFCWFLKSGILVAISVPGIDPVKAAHIAAAINWWTVKMFPFAVVACVIIALTDVYRIIRVRTKAAHSVPLNVVSGAH
jgi:hypothetical protein